MKTEEEQNKQNIATVQQQRQQIGQQTAEGKGRNEQQQQQTQQPEELFWVAARSKKNFDALQKVAEILEESRMGGDLETLRNEILKANNLVKTGKKRKYDQN